MASLETAFFSPSTQSGEVSYILVDNGSTDATADLLSAASHRWLEVSRLAENAGYGGGILHGLSLSTAPFVGFIPGDLQITAVEIEAVYARMLKSGFPEKTFWKGRRVIRKDGPQTRFVSRVYTAAANRIIGMRTSDVNGLPKIFSRALLPLLAQERMKTFVLDAQLIATAFHHGWTIEEVPVTFHARREGVSSWSNKRIRVYLNSLRSLWRIRQGRLALPKPERSA